MDAHFDFPRLIFNSQAKANIRSIRRIGQQSRGSLLDYVHDPFWKEGERTGGLDEFLQGTFRACRVARELHERETGASIGITVDAGVIISTADRVWPGRGHARSTFCTAGSLMRESRDTREPNHDRDPPPLFRGTTRFYPTLSLRRNAGFDE